MVSGALVCHAECGASVRPCKDLCIPRCIHTHTHICHHQVCTHRPVTTWCVHTHDHHQRKPGLCHLQEPQSRRVMCQLERKVCLQTMGVTGDQGGGHSSQMVVTRSTCGVSCEMTLPRGSPSGDPVSYLGIQP